MRTHLMGVPGVSDKSCRNKTFGQRVYPDHALSLIAVEFAARPSSVLTPD